MSNPSLILPQSPAYGEDYVYAAQVNDGVVPLYNVLPLTFTRASNGTRINKDGILENMPYNLLENTNTFSSWNLEGGTLTSGFTAPDGSSTAYKYVQIPGGGLYSGFSGVTSDVKCAQIWIKSVSGGSLTVNLSDGASYFGQFNVTGEWQLFTGQYTGNTRIGLYLYAISNAQGIYVWHPQLNIGSTAKPYLATTDRLNMPRITYPVGGGCGALLLEKQSTNLILQSEAFNSASWAPFTMGSGTVNIIANTAISPDGTQNADEIRLTRSVLTDQAVVYQQQYASNATYSRTIYLKAARSQDVGKKVDVWSYDGSLINPISATLTANWQRFDAGTATGTLIEILSFGYLPSSLYPTTSGTDVRFYAWGAQGEASSYATSYIPTTSTSATRIADACYKTGISNLIGQTEGTMFVDFTMSISGDNYQSILIGNGTERVYFFYLKPSNVFGWSVYIGGSGFMDTNTTFSPTNGQRYKIALAYKSGSNALYINGALVASSSATIGSATLANFYFSYLVGNELFNMPINQTQLFTTRLTNAELATLTTI